MSENATETMNNPIQANQQQNYWGFFATEKFFFPDGVTFIEHKVMNEGDKVKFQKKTGRDITLSRQGDAKLKLDAGSERHELIKTCAKGWNLIREGRDGSEPVPFDMRNIDNFLDVADPQIIEDLETSIRKANPWLLGEQNLEELLKQRDELDELIKDARERESGEAGSVNK